MKLLGVIHLQKYLDDTCGSIDSLFSQNPPKSIMVELPVNFDELVKTKRFPTKNFFTLLCNRYRQIY
ncbi:hypothetical protein HYT25_04910 [Candidatus Pacearchaeota archaeon]|nr:hypothetical protein [Candidatus Pacearchaeota archaeon]